MYSRIYLTSAMTSVQENLLNTSLTGGRDILMYDCFLKKRKFLFTKRVNDEISFGKVVSFQLVKRNI